MPFQPIRLLLIFFFSCFLCCGCRDDSRPDDLPQLHPCQIVFSQEGKPLVGAIVFLHPTDPASRWTSGGTTDEQGIVTLMTHARFSGVPLGEYKVTVSKSEQFQEILPQVVPGGDGTEMTPGSPLQRFLLVEKEYSDATATPLSIKIEKKKNRMEFDLGKAIREKIPD